MESGVRFMLLRLFLPPSPHGGSGFVKEDAGPFVLVV